MNAEQMLIDRIGEDSFAASHIDVEPSMIIELMKQYASSKLDASKSAEEIFNTIPYLDRGDDYFNMPRTKILAAMEEYASLRVAEAKPQSISIEEFIEEWNVGYEDFEQKAEFANLMRSQIQAMIAEANKWVSVKDRLPQENKLVQCSSVRIHMGGETRQETRMGRLINANHPRFSCDVDWVKTTHWKELDEFVLPTPPTE